VGADAGPSGSNAGWSAEARASNRPAAALGGGETRATAASSSTPSTVERGVRGPVGKSAGAGALLPFRNRLRIDPIALGQRPQTVRTSLDRAPNDPRRRGASVQYLAHSASFHSDDEIAPSKPGIKHLAASRDTRLDGDLGGTAPDIASVKICETRGKWDAPQSSHSPCCAWLARPARSAHTHAACHIPSHQWPRARRTAPGAATAAAIPTAEFIGAPWRDYAFSPLHPNTQRANQPLSGD
jgi:hypothetical protein